jgi:hypothetical protein
MIVDKKDRAFILEVIEKYLSLIQSWGDEEFEGESAPTLTLLKEAEEFKEEPAATLALLNETKTFVSNYEFS